MPNEVQELPRKKRSQTTSFARRIDCQVQEWLNHHFNHSDCHCTRNYYEQRCLSCNGDSVLNLTTDWAKSLLNRMGFVKRKACSKTKVDRTAKR